MKMVKLELGVCAAALMAAMASGCASMDSDASGGDGAGLTGAGGQNAEGGADDGGGDDQGGNGVGPGVGQGGAQDFGQFRAILEAGDIPGPETLDDVGFFNEHKIELPGPDCGEDICIHGALGQMGNLLTGSDCTMVLVGMNTPIDLAEIERPPLNLAVVIDTSGSMEGQPITRVREGLFRMVDALQPEDRVTLVTFSNSASIRAEVSGGNSAEINAAIGGLAASGQTNIYEGLWEGYQAVEQHAAPGLQNRVLLLSDGEATVGITNDDKIIGLASALSAEGIALSTIGLGVDFDPVLMRRLSEVGAGSFYFIDDVQAVEEVFEEEVTALLMPLGLDVQIGLDAGPGWEVRALYGTKLAEVAWNQARVDIPSLHIAHRETTDDVEHGRRGGGGVILAEVMRRPGAGPADEGPVGQLHFQYRTPGTEDYVDQVADITGVGTEDYFQNEGAEKSFIMLNLYVAFRMAAERAAVGDDLTALSTLEALREGVAGWLQSNDDFDIEDDLRYVDMFIDNLKDRGAANPPPSQNPPPPPPPPEPWPQD